MATSISLSETNFFKSRQIKVYPASFRGSYEANTKFDPESTLTTEYNITRPRIAGDKETYIVSWNAKDRKLACVIGGYYFEISNADANALANKYLCISKRTVDLTDKDGTDSQRATSVLASFTGNKAALDEMDQNNGYFFTGLLISASESAGEFRLKAFLDNGAVNYAEFIPNIRSGGGNAGNQPTSLVFGDSATATADRSVAVGDHANANGAHSFAFGSGASAAKDNSVAIGSGAQATGVSSVAIGNEAKASGEHAVSIGNGTIASGANSHASGFTTTAGGECSQASGNNTTASGMASVAEGNAATASGKYSHAGGNGSKAIGNCSAAFGDHAVAGYDNQFALGAFNKNEENSVFEIGNGTAEDSRKNIFKVDKEGNTALKSLTASGNLKVMGTAEFGKDGKEALIVGENQVTINPKTVFNDSVTAKNLTVGDNLTVTGKLSADASGTTVNKRLTIQGEHSLVYDSATGSLAVGTHNSTGAGAAALTSGSDASGANAFAIGAKNNVSGDGSAAFGTGNTVSEEYSLASGIGNTVSGTGSAAIGSVNANAKNNAAVFGKGNVANSDGELVIGSFNKRDQSDYPEYFAIGNGTDEGNRNTAFKIAGTGVGKPTEAYIDGKPIATHVMEDTTFKQSLLNLLYPIGSVYVYSGSRDNLNTITDNGNTWCECPIRQTLGGTWTPVEDHFLYAGNQAVSKTTAYNALGHEGGSNKAYIVDHTHGIENSGTLTTENGLTNDLFIGVPTGDHGRATVWPNKDGGNNASDTEHNNWTSTYGPDLNTVGRNNGQGYIEISHESVDKKGKSNKLFGNMMDKEGNMHENDLMVNNYRKPTIIQFYLSHQHDISPHTHGCTKQKNDNGDINGIASGDQTANMPQYLCVYAWKRIA